MQILKSISAKQMFKTFPEIKKELLRGEFWSDGGYIGTVGESVTAELIRDYIEKQGTLEEKEGYKQMNLLDFD
jgi:putative transposase